MASDDISIIEVTWDGNTQEEEIDGLDDWTEPQLVPEGEYIMGIKIKDGRGDGINGLTFLTTKFAP